MEGLKESEDIFCFCQSGLNKSIEQAKKISDNDNSSAYEKALEIDELVPLEATVRNWYAIISKTMPKHAKWLVKLYNCLCDYTQDSQTISCKFTRKRQQITDLLS